MSYSEFISSIVMTLLISRVSGISFPHTFPPDTTKITLTNQNIPTIDYIEPYPLEKLVLTKIKLTKFPDLINVSTTLLSLNLRDNQIKRIKFQYLNDLIVLESLTLDDNPLKYLPDATGPGNTLHYLHLSRTHIKRIPAIPGLGRSLRRMYFSNARIRELPAADLESFPFLHALYVRNMALKRYPNVCDVTFRRRTKIFFRGSTMLCRENLVWTSYALQDGFMQVSSNARCTSPPELSGRMMSSVTIEEFKGFIKPDLQSVQLVFRRIDDLSKFHCRPVIVDVIQIPSVIRCAGKCLQADRCAIFAFDRGNCVITSAEPSVTDPFSLYAKWYTLNTDRTS